MTQALRDLLETLDSNLAKSIDDLETYRGMLEELGDDEIDSYYLAMDYIERLEDIRGTINA